MKRSKLTGVLALVLMGTIVGVGATPASATSTTTFAASEESPLPDVLTNEQMEAISEGPESSGSELQLKVAASCVLDPGIMWRRTSGSGYPNGTVGSKPKMRNCTGGVATTQLSSDVFLHNGWLWLRVAGTFNSYGTGNMEQKSVKYICNGSAQHTFKVITVGTVKFSDGSAGSTRRSTPEASFACG